MFLCSSVSSFYTNLFVCVLQLLVHAGHDTDVIINLADFELSLSISLQLGGVLDGLHDYGLEVGVY